MRRGFFCYLFLRCEGDQTQLASALSQHKNWKNLQIYVENAIISSHIKFKKDLRIPNLIVNTELKE